MTIRLRNELFHILKRTLSVRYILVKAIIIIKTHPIFKIKIHAIKYGN